LKIQDIELIHLKDNLNAYLMTLPEFDVSNLNKLTVY